MKLELKHVQTYPLGKDGVKVMIGIDKIRFINMISIDENEVCVEDAYGLDEWMPISELKLILRPLSDLTKEIEHNGEKFVPNEYMQEITGLSKATGRDFLSGFFFGELNLRGTTLHAYMKFFEWHFDVFGLIKEGLAIDINTLKTA